MNDGPAQYALVANKPLHFPKVEVIWVVRHMHARVQSPTCPFWSCLLPTSLIDHSPCSIAKLMRLRNFPTCFEPTSFLKIVRDPPLTPSVVTPSKHDCIHPAKAVFNTSPRFGSAPHLTDRRNNLSLCVMFNTEPILFPFGNYNVDNIMFLHMLIET